jgi:uncharacterized protein DUF6220
MTWARPTFQWLVWIFGLGVVIQFFLAGMGVLGGESIEAHQALGSLLILLSLIMLILAFIAKLERPMIIMTAVLFVLMVLQSVFAQPDLDPVFLRTFHVFDALLIAGLVQHLAVRVGWPMKTAIAPGGG